MALCTPLANQLLSLSRFCLKLTEGEGSWRSKCLKTSELVELGRLSSWSQHGWGGGGFTCYTSGTIRARDTSCNLPVYYSCDVFFNHM